MMSTDLGLSERGNELRQSSSQSFADYLMEHFRRMSNPDYIALCIAENRLMWPELSAQLDNIGLGCLEAGDLCYGDDTGLNYFKRNLLEFLRSWIVGNEVNWKPDDMIIMNGCGSVLSMLFFVICDPGDVVLVPSPLYWGFYNDLKTIPKAEMEAVPMDMEKGFYLEVSRFEEAYARVSRSGKKCSALLLSSP